MNPTSAARRPSNYMRAWREARGLSLVEMGTLIGAHKSTLSRIETDKIPYYRDILEGYARVIGCQPGDLLNRPPGMAEELFRLLDQCGPDDLARAEAVIKLLIKQQT